VAEAQANARMALMLAIGKLQQHAGSDMRVTASADILTADNPPLLGVWKSWEGSNHEASGTLKGRPIAPVYTSKTQKVSDGGRFVSWLVSGAGDSPATADAASLVLKTADLDAGTLDGGTVKLVSSGSVPQLTPAQIADAIHYKQEVHVIPTEVENSGAMAWWISGENQKARIPKPYDESNPSIADWADRNHSHAVSDPEPFGLDPILADPSLAN
jgi:hypothetical protein